MSFRPGARQFFERRGAPTPSVPTARDYVQADLIAMWDGIENAGWGVHDAAATTWKDLVGAIGDFTLDNAPTISKDEILFQNNAYGTCSCNVEFNDTVTYEVVCRYLQASCTIIHATTRGHGDIVPYNFTPTLGGEFYYHGISIKPFDSSFYPKAQIGERCSMSWTVDGAVWAAYSNGIIYAERTDGVKVQSAKMTSISCSMYGSVTKLSAISNVRIYNRALTADEITANYAIDKARFNLP